ncbi:MAG: 2TM domain-containing protein [Candidatus Bathyarchaeia archaeon]
MFTGGFHGVFPWFVFPLVFWAIGLIAHGLTVFAHTSYLDRMTEQEYKKLKEEQGNSKQ